jgi:hypothetical protein
MGVNFSRPKLADRCAASRTLSQQKNFSSFGGFFEKSGIDLRTTRARPALADSTASFRLADPRHRPCVRATDIPSVDWPLESSLCFEGSVPTVCEILPPPGVCSWEGPRSGRYCVVTPPFCTARTKPSSETSSRTSLIRNNQEWVSEYLEKASMASLDTFTYCEVCLVSAYRYA